MRKEQTSDILSSTSELARKAAKVSRLAPAQPTGSPPGFPRELKVLRRPKARVGIWGRLLGFLACSRRTQ